MGFFAHEQALVESPSIGNDTRIWAFAHVLRGATIGDDCNICDHVFIENDVVIGDRVTIKCGVQVWDGITIEDDVFIGPNATFTNDLFPRSRQWAGASGRTVIRRGASLGANCTILPDLVVGEGAMVGAGAVVTTTVPRHAIVVGNPAKIIGYVDPDSGRRIRATEPEGGEGVEASTGAIPTSVQGVTLHRFPVMRDMRGSLVAGEFPATIPFEPRRYFMVFDVPGTEVRGEHAHRECHQFLIAARGQLSVVADDGSRRQELRLEDNRTGIYLPPMTWGTQYRYSADAILLVLASHPYDADDYIRDYDEFAHLVAVAAGNQQPR
jgi:UDP-2-acetamido-3-amino-2,3-dideoxy-glucuronate N-acetyltransferase